MPKTQEIIDGLQSIANEYSSFAMLWHVAFYALILFLVNGWMPSTRLFILMLSLPLISVAVFAWITGNPFNGAIFSLFALLLLFFGLKSTTEPVALSQVPFVTIGILMVIFGLVYPHFLGEGSFLRYLYASPAGLVPCPTLSVLIGLMLIYAGSGSQAVTFVLIIAGLFYSLFGVFKLGVKLDIFLLVGTLTLIGKYIVERKFL